jgi:subtilisin family serine protease
MTISIRAVLRFAVLCFAASTTTTAAPDASTYFPGQVLVKYKTAPPGTAVQPGPQLAGARVKAVMPRLGWQLVELPAGLDVATALEAYRSRPDVAHVEPNYRIRLFTEPNDSRWPAMWNLTQINAPQAWDTTTGSAAVVVAMLDTGIDWSHPDLAANVWTNPSDIPGNNADDDQNGFVDDVHGCNLLTQTGDVRDDDGHGTHVAGTIGAVGNNGLGVVGVNWQVKLLAAKIFSADDSAGTAGAVGAYDYLLGLKERGVNLRVINNSWGGPVPSRALAEAVRAAEAAGILTVCSAGNSYQNADDQPSFPATVDCESLISVAASTRDDEAAAFSNYGALTVDLAAPGESILSTYRGAGHYERRSGTSMASPHVAGAAALLFARSNSLSPAGVKALLMASVDRQPHWQARLVSGGRLNVGSAMARLLSGPPPALLPETNELALPFPRVAALSRSERGRWGTDSSYSPSMSTNGQFVAFLSLATNLAPGVSGQYAQVYLHDRTARTTTLISRSSSGVPAAGTEARISGNGRYVVFSSPAGNLVTGDNNNLSDVFLFDRTTGQIELISKTPLSASGNAASDSPGISDDGRYVVFASDARNLINADGNAARDVFVRDRQTATTTRASVSSGEVAANYTSDLPSISGDGRYITFLSGADNLVSGTYYPAYQLYLRDRVAGTTVLVSKSAGNVPGRGNSGYSSLSADGRYIAFDSAATNLVSSDTNLVQDVFLWDRVGLVMKRISVGNNGVQGDDASWLPFVTANGRYVHFMSFATTLYSQDNHYGSDIFAYDRLSAELSRLTYNHAGRASIDDSYVSTASADGRLVAFDSAAWNLAPGDGNGAADVFLLDRGAAIPDLMISVAGDTNLQGIGLHGTNIVQRRQLALSNAVASFFLRLDNDGPASEVFSVRASAAPPGWAAQFFRGTTNITSTVTGTGWTNSLAAGSNVVLRLDVTSVDAAVGESWAEWFVVASGMRTNSAQDAVRAVVTRTPSPPSLQVVSRASDGRAGNNGSGPATLSADGRFVAFTSLASDFAAKDYNLQEDVFVFDRQGLTIECLSQAESGETGNGRSFDPQISRDGRYVVFQSAATNLISGDTNDRDDLFLADRQTRTISRISTGPGGSQSARNSGSPSLSGDGRYIVFESLAENFVPGDANGTWDIFLRDRIGGTLECVSLAGGGTGNDESHSPVVSRDGSVVVFTSLASNLSPGDTNEAHDVFLWQRGSAGLQLLSRNASGVAGNDISTQPSISDDGGYVLFSSRATNLAVPAFTTNSITFLYERQTGRLSQLDPPRIAGRQRRGYFGARLTPDGGSVTLLADVSASPGSSNFMRGVFVYHLDNGEVVELSRLRSGTPGHGHSEGATMSANGRYLALASRAANLIGETVPDVDQLFVFDTANFQPDEWVRRASNGPYRGQNLFSPVCQWVEQTVNLTFTNVFFATIENRGNFADWFVFKAPTNVTGAINARYFLQPAGTEITAAVAGTGWPSELLAPGASLEVRIQIVASNTNLFNQDLVFTTTSVTDPAKVDAVRVRLLRDDDNDGLPNTWEQQYFGNPTNTLGAADIDGDGSSNLDEFIAGTRPDSMTSSLRITKVRAEPGPTLTLTWPTVTNRIYTIERAGYEPMDFTALGAILGNSLETSYSDLTPTNAPAFYRIRAEVP